MVPATKMNSEQGTPLGVHYSWDLNYRAASGCRGIG